MHRDDTVPPAQSLLCPLPSGVSLQIILQPPPTQRAVLPGGASQPKKLAVLLHPWSWLGGSMHDPVLHALLDPLTEKGYHTLRYNSRGCGKSTGRSSFSGAPEAQDLQELINWALEEIGGVERVAIIGYSHGSLIASLCPPIASPVQTSYLLLSYPLSPRGLLTFFRSGTYNDALVLLAQNPNVDLLIIYGDADEFTATSKYDVWTEDLVKALNAETRPSTQIVKIPGGSHFWRGKTGEHMLYTVQGWLV